MFKKPHCPVIALEEHYWDDELEKTYTGGEAGRPGEQYTRLKDLGALRLKEMDQAAIDIQVLSHGAPSTQKLPAETAAATAKCVNDRLHAVVAANPARFAAFAALPTAVPEAAADEFERTAARSASKAPCCTASPTARSSTTSGSGRSMRAPRCSTCRSTCIRRCRRPT
jgi:2,3-dihydroxybenzoate decarboxylase